MKRLNSENRNGSKLTYIFELKNPHNEKTMLRSLSFMVIPSSINGKVYQQKYWIWSGGGATYKTYRDAIRHYTTAGF